MFLSIQDCLLIQLVVSAVMAIHITSNNDRNGRNNNHNGNKDRNSGDVCEVGLDILCIRPNIGSARYTWNRVLAYILLPVEKVWQIMYDGKKYYKTVVWYELYL